MSLSSYSQKNTRAPWLNGLPDLEGDSVVLASRLHDEIVAYVDYMTPTPEEEIVVAEVGKRVRGVLGKPFRNGQVHTGGSTASGLRLPESDIDLVIETTDFVAPKYGLMKLARMVREEPWCESVEEILGARVPIIKFLTKPGFGSLHFDVGINGAAGLKNGEWVKDCLKTMPALRPLVLVIKGALSQRGLNDASLACRGLSSFAVICMCVFFLQLNQDNLRKEYLADPIKTRSLGAILYGFLTFYSEKIPYQRMYISVSGGRLESRAWASWIDYRSEDVLVIQCPNDPRRNITGSLSLLNWNKIRQIFAQAKKEILEDFLSSRGILGALVLVNSEFIERRQSIRQLVQSGRLEENLEWRKRVSYRTESGTLVEFDSTTDMSDLLRELQQLRLGIDSYRSRNR